MIGILALQGGFAAHRRALISLGHQTVLVKEPKQLDDIDGLVLPGGESSAQLKLLHHADMIEPLLEFCRSGKPVFATCAGLILLAKEVRQPAQESLGILGVTVERNAWGRQRHSFEDTSDIASFPLVFIRAPRILDIDENVEVIETYKDEPIMIRQHQVYAATFHPELTPNTDIHQRVFGP